MTRTLTLAKATIPLILEDTYVRQDEEGRYSLNDIHQAAVDAGHDYKRCQVEHFTRTDSTQALAEELRKSGELKVDPLVSRVGRYGGSYAVRELVYAYAMWISPAFHLKVIRTFDALVTGKISATGNAFIGKFSGLPLAHLIGLQDQVHTLITRLKRERCGELWATYYRQLQAACRDLGQDAPPLSVIGHAAPLQPPSADAFWQAVAQLEAAGVRLNHSRRADLVAVNLQQCMKVAAARGIKLPNWSELRRSLRECVRPRFVDTRPVNSVILGHAVRCGVFEVIPTEVEI